MKRYLIKNADGSKQTVMRAIHNSRKEAGETLMDYICDHNEDGFVPDFSDCYQNKWFPWFKYDKDAAGFVCAYTNNTPTIAYAQIGSRLCFKSSARAKQFGKQFAELYNKVFL